MRPHLLLVLEAPLQSWGTVMVDALGRIDAFPAASMVVGLGANALGYDRCDGRRLAALQDRLVLGAAILREGTRITDSQNARLAHDDRGWTTRGRPEGRAGASYDGPHRRFRDYAADAAALLALRLEPAADDPTLETLERALIEPERPLFLGRRPCPPARRLVLGQVAAATVVDALEAGIAMLRAAPASPRERPLAVDAGALAARWPAEEGDRPHSRIETVHEDRDWDNDVHAGSRRRRVALLQPAETVA